MAPATPPCQAGAAGERTGTASPPGPRPPRGPHPFSGGGIQPLCGWWLPLAGRAVTPRRQLRAAAGTSIDQVSLGPHLTLATGALNLCIQSVIGSGKCSPIVQAPARDPNAPQLPLSVQYSAVGIGQHSYAAARVGVARNNTVQRPSLGRTRTTRLK